MAGEQYVLVVDDEPGIRNLVRIVLEADGLQVHAAADAPQALLAAAMQPPALMLLDYMLPGMNGIELARTLRQRHGPTLPVIFMSALDLPDSALREVLHARFIAKPFDIDALAEAVRADLPTTSLRQPGQQRVVAPVRRPRASGRPRSGSGP